MRRHLTYANVMATFAAFVALGGTAAASFIVNSNADIGPGTVSGAKPPTGDHSNVIAGSIGAADLASSSVNNSKLATNAVTTAKLAASAVTTGKVKDGSLTGADLAADTLTGTQIDESSLGPVPNATNSSFLGGVFATAYQRSVSGSCAAGSAIGAVNSSGGVTCNDTPVRPGSSSLTLGGITLSARHCAKLEIPLSGMAVNDTAILAPDAATWPAGLIMTALRADQANKVPLDVCNPTDASVSSPSLAISVWELKIAP